MNRSILPSVIFGLVCLAAPFHLVADDPDISVRKIWDQAPHNAFTDIARHQGRFYCAFREGTGHVPGASGKDGTIRVIASANGQDWKSVALLREEGIDLRDPKLSIAADDRLMLVMGGSDYDGTKLLRRRSRVAFWNAEAGTFDATIPVEMDPAIVHDTDWLWRVTWHDGIGYGVVYQPGKTPWGLHLVKTRDGIRYDLVSTLNIPGKPNESTVRFTPAGEMLVVVRNEDGQPRGHLGRAVAPFTDWKWVTVNHKLGGPNMLRLPNGEWVLGSRAYDKPTHTVVGRLALDGTFTRVVTLPSAGDTSYPGLLLHEEALWVVYYSSHEGRTAIYLATIPLTKFVPAVGK